ncbi:MAG TPA: hypothetical protein VM326_02335 [Sphingomicrobium sp.]|nr:hypothetical protein [Sphingomicrobium sp.]
MSFRIATAVSLALLTVCAGAAPPPAEKAPLTVAAEPVTPDRPGDIAPPERFQGEGWAVVITARQAGVETLCGKAAAGRTVACALTDRRIVVTPNPCLFATREWYAAILCHEIAHLNGWSGEHDQ